MPLWKGRFEKESDPQMWALNASIYFDQRMAEQDLRGSLIWAAALKSAGILSQDEHSQISAGLTEILAEYQAGELHFEAGDEDIHTAVERRLGELIGPLAGKLHTGRSRNDQVATDFRLWILDHLPRLESALEDLQTSLLSRAESDLGIIMPGYTHLQRAQPILLSHWWLSHFWPLQRDRQRLDQLRARVAVLPLGCGALAGTPLEIDRAVLADSLGFDSPAPNSIDAVSDRDFAVEFNFVAAMIGIHLSKLAENLVIYTSAEFGFFELDDAYSTGSSLMPQKKNPDPFELARGKTGSLIGYLTGLLATLKGLPSAYDKDLQEDKVPVFSAFDTLMSILPVISQALDHLMVYDQRMQAAVEPSMMATDLADYLVERGIPFREAHALVGETVRYALAQQKSIAALSLSEYKKIHPCIEDDVQAVFDPGTSVNRRRAIGGTALEAVKQQMTQAKQGLSRGKANES
jgi:argininosuccinate lyase